jgi:type IV pilus assembly protein PilE
MNETMQRTVDRPPGALRRMAGVTLLELLTVVTIIGILGMIAIPSYRQYTRRAHRTEAKTALLELAANQERFYLQNRRYGTIAELAAANFPVASENGVYTMAITTVNGLAVDYTATATPVAGGGTNGIVMTDDTECASFSITSQGVKSATPDPSNRCW